MNPIVIYDSGVGGLSIYDAVRLELPNADLVFVSDNAAFPYGTKDDDWLVQRVSEVAEKIEQSLSPQVLVVACNTASTVALPVLRTQHKFPVVGVVPAIKPAASLTASKHIGLLATPATVGRDYTEQLITDFAGGCTVTKVGSSALVEQAEAKLRGEPLDLPKIEAILEPFLSEQNLDALVLACTHFPLLNKEIEGIFEKHSRPVALVASGDAIARRVNSLLSGVAHEPSESQAQLSAYFTRELKSSTLKSALHSRGMMSIKTLPL